MAATLFPVRILVVEDEVLLARSLARGLTAEGFDVDVVHDGTDGLWHAREHTYGAIVLDLLLPGMNGYQICRTLRAEQNWTPVLMLTSKDGEYDEAEALDTGQTTSCPSRSPSSCSSPGCAPSPGEARRPGPPSSAPATWCTTR